MAFDSLSETYRFLIDDFPREWLPLTYLYDPDLPLFPIQYFHVLDPDLKGARPGQRDRVFGFIHHINLVDAGLEVTLLISKDLSIGTNHKFKSRVEQEVRERLGLGNPIYLRDIEYGLKDRLTNGNDLIRELWYKVIDDSFGKCLPFGNVWDPVFGLSRWVASWNSAGGRKGELIQLHAFVSVFGERIQLGGEFHADFYLLPTFEEFRDASNPMGYFPKMAGLLRAAENFVHSYCDTVNTVEGDFSKFELKRVGRGNQIRSDVILGLIEDSPPDDQEALFDNFSIYDRGPQRSIISLMMMHDIRVRNWDPANLTADSGELYDDLKGSYQTPKVIHLYAQQCFGNPTVLPIDNWVTTFVGAPLAFVPSKKKHFYTELFACSDVWGKIERLIWIAAQARKVHASVCSDILWCIRFGSRKVGATPGKLRAANPLACKICVPHIRDVCPSFSLIKHRSISFNNPIASTFNITTSLGNNIDKGQRIEACESALLNLKDEYSTRDQPESFGVFPSTSHNPHGEIDVETFLKLY